MIMKRTFYALILFFFLFSACSKQADVTRYLPRGVPEAEGVSSEGIIQFLDSAAKSRNEFHSIMVLRHGKVVAEGWWNPYRADLKHTLYSTSKSFTSTAVGLAISEKKLNLSDKVVSFFPNDLPDTVSANLASLTVRDLLMMSAGQDPEPTGQVVSKDSNWVKGFLAAPIVHNPGSVFLYNSLATYMLSAIVQKVTGEKVIDYLTPRLFKPLYIEGIDWETDPQGINTGGWGLRLKTEDMAKFGQLLLQKGKWNGKQIIPSAWVEEATTFKIDQAPGAPQSKKDSSDWMQGYCYQFWRCRHNAFRADGAFGQYIIVIPDKDAVVAITAETPDMQDEINLVWKYILPALKDMKLPANEAKDDELKQRLLSLALPVPPKGAASPLAEKISGKTYLLSANDRHINAITFTPGQDSWKLTLKTDTATFDLNFASGVWEPGETTLHGPNLVAGAINNQNGLPPFKIDGAFYWQDQQTLVFVLRYVESPHTLTLFCKFDKDKVSVDFKNSFAYGMKTVPVEGKLMK